jgi:hypothetical protein
MKSVKGMMMPGVGAMSTQQMNVTAGTVNVGSAALTGPTGPSEMSRLASGGRAAAVGGSPSEKKGAAATLASAGSAAKVSGSPKEFAGPGKVTPNMSLGASVRMGYQNVPGAENTAKRIERAAMRRDAALAYAGPGLTSRMGESIRSKYRDLSARGAGTTAYAAAAGMTSAERGGLSASEYAAGGPTTGVTYGQAMKNSLTRAGAQARYAAFAAADRGQLLARRVAGAAGRGMDYMRMGAWDPELTNPRVALSMSRTKGRQLPMNAQGVLRNVVGEGLPEHQRECGHLDKICALKETQPDLAQHSRSLERALVAEWGPRWDSEWQANMPQKKCVAPWHSVQPYLNSTHDLELQ